MGRHKKPRAMLIREGTYEPGRHEDRGDGMPWPGEPTKLPGLGEDGRWLWDQVIAMTPPGVLTGIDSAALFGMCRWWQKYRTADRAGEDRQAKAAWGEFMSLASRFGMTPADRAKFRASSFGYGPGQSDPFAELRKVG